MRLKSDSRQSKTSPSIRTENIHSIRMKVEVNSAADFLMNLLRINQQKHSNADDSQLQSFKGSLENLLASRYKSHWYPDVPIKGSGYRCIRINGKMDPVVEQAGVASGLTLRSLQAMLPTELTLWIDPEEVAYRIGENGSICVLYESPSRASPSSDLDSTGSGAMSGDEFIANDYLEQNGSSSSPSSSVYSSTNSTPTKPTDGRFFGVPSSMSPQFHRNGMKYQQQHQLPPVTNQFLRQHMNGAQQQQLQYLQQAQPNWEGFGNNNKVGNNNTH